MFVYEHTYNKTEKSLNLYNMAIVMCVNVDDKTGEWKNNMYVFIVLIHIQKHFLKYPRDDWIYEIKRSHMRMDDSDSNPVEINPSSELMSLLDYKSIVNCVCVRVWEDIHVCVCVCKNRNLKQSFDLRKSLATKLLKNLTARFVVVWVDEEKVKLLQFHQATLK